MDAFEQVVSEIPGTVGLWVRTSINVELTPKQKALIGRPTSPRWELDIVAYSGLENLLYAVERKSYLNSRRVTFAGLTGADTATAGRYKLFSKANDTLRKVVFDRLKTQLNEPPTTASLPNPKVRLCLAREHIASAGDRKNCAIIRGPGIGNSGTKIGLVNTCREWANPNTKTRFPTLWQNCCVIRLIERALKGRGFSCASSWPKECRALAPEGTHDTAARDCNQQRANLLRDLKLRGAQAIFPARTMGQTVSRNAFWVPARALSASCICPDARSLPSHRYTKGQPRIGDSMPEGRVFFSSQT